MVYTRGILLDTGALYALADTNDQYHSEAVKCLDSIHNDSHPLFVSNVTIYEAYRLILHRLGIRKALHFLESVFDGTVQIEYISRADEVSAKDYLRRYSNKAFTFVDALNFVVMQRIKICKAFAFDGHFNIIGFISFPPYYSD